MEIFLVSVIYNHSNVFHEIIYLHIRKLFSSLCYKIYSTWICLTMSKIINNSLVSYTINDLHYFSILFLSIYYYYCICTEEQNSSVVFCIKILYLSVLFFTLKIATTNPNILTYIMELFDLRNINGALIMIKKHK